MKTLSLLAALALASCASVPNYLSEINHEVNATRTYSYYHARDWRYLKPGDSGNCAAFAFTKYVELAKMGKSSVIRGCNLTNGVGHAFLVTQDGWVLDNRFDEVVREWQVGCE